MSEAALESWQTITSLLLQLLIQYSMIFVKNHYPEEAKLSAPTGELTLIFRGKISSDFISMTRF